MRFFKLLGYGNPLGAFFFTFKTLDALVGPFVVREIAIQKAGSPRVFVDKRIIIVFQYIGNFDAIGTRHTIFAVRAGDRR